jgi:type IV pilus assembly protein PilE
MRRNEKGFTLMELMVVIVIVAILAAVAVPLYINYVKDAQRTEAKGAIGAVVTAEQTYYQVHNTYTNDVFVPITTPPTGTQILNCDLTDALHNWDINVTDASADGFLVTATGKNAADGLSQTLTFSRTAAPVWNPE